MLPFDRIADFGTHTDIRYPDGARAWQGRLSADDQREFDKQYANWLEDTRRNDRDDIDKDARRVQDIIARNNVPANVPYDQIASPDARSLPLESLALAPEVLSAMHLPFVHPGRKTANSEVRGC